MWQFFHFLEAPGGKKRINTASFTCEVDMEDIRLNVSMTEG